MKAAALAYSTDNEICPQTIRSFTSAQQTERFVQPAHSGETQTCPEVMVDAHFRIRSANRSFCDQFRISPSVSNGSWLFSLGTAQWDHVAIRTMLDEAAVSNTSQECVAPMDLPGVGRCLVRLTAQRRQNSHPLELIAIRIEECTVLRKTADNTTIAVAQDSDDLSLSRSTQITLRGLCRELALIIGCAQTILERGDADQQENAEDIISAAHLIQSAHSSLLAQARDVTHPTVETWEVVSNDAMTARPQLRMEEAEIMPPVGLAMSVAKNRNADHLVYA
ncbi:MAG: hypothetical protein H7Y38_17010 [Armatimonadetes bacterium]|nr:hypothetical protein [Armatimonadota bacterium]